jgi:hypothetical protein
MHGSALPAQGKMNDLLSQLGLEIASQFLQTRAFFRMFSHKKISTGTQVRLSQS